MKCRALKNYVHDPQCGQLDIWSLDEEQVIKKFQIKVILKKKHTHT